MRPPSIRLLLLSAASAALAGCEPEPPILGRPATEAEKKAMPAFLITLARREITILSPLRPELPGCEIELDERWRTVIPPQEFTIPAHVAYSDLRDEAGRPPRGRPVRVDVTCPGESGPVRYTGRRSPASASNVIPWIWPAEAS